MSFVLSAAIVETGLGLATPSTCRGAVILCLSFYVGSKVTMCVSNVLVEHLHG